MPLVVQFFPTNDLSIIPSAKRNNKDKLSFDLILIHFKKAVWVNELITMKTIREQFILLGCLG